MAYSCCFYNNKLDFYVLFKRLFRHYEYRCPVSFIYIYDYYNLFLLCTPIYFLGHTFLYCIRSEGLIGKVLKINIVAFVVNLITGCVFIKFLNWGFVGSALSTILANLSICIVSFFHFRKTIFKIKLKNIRFEKTIRLIYSLLVYLCLYQDSVP